VIYREIRYIGSEDKAPRDQHNT